MAREIEIKLMATKDRFRSSSRKTEGIEQQSAYEMH